MQAGHLGKTMNEDFDNLIESVDDLYYITIESTELTLDVIPFFSLPANMINELYKKKKTSKQLEYIYELIHISMREPSRFNELVYNTSVSYTGILDFINKWLDISILVEQHTNNKVDDYGNVTTQHAVREIDVLKNIIYSKLARNEPIKHKMLIRYFIEHIKELADSYNKELDDDNEKIESIYIQIEEIDNDNNKD